MKHKRRVGDRPVQALSTPIRVGEKRSRRKTSSTPAEVKRMWPHALKRRSKYVPAGPAKNCGWWGVSPKLFRNAMLAGNAAAAEHFETTVRERKLAHFN